MLSHLQSTGGSSCNVYGSVILNRSYGIASNKQRNKVDWFAHQRLGLSEIPGKAKVEKERERERNPDYVNCNKNKV